MPEYARDEHAQPHAPIPLVHEGGDDHPQEWVVLEHAGTGTPGGFLVVEWDHVKDEVRSDGPIVYNNPPHAPAP